MTLLPLAALGLVFCMKTTIHAATPVSSPAVTQSLVLGGGCFWCLDASYRLIPGVVGVTSGFAGGTAANPSYKQVCSGATGHAEVVKIDFDPAVVSLERLFEFFWKIHDPTTPNRQGNDVGSHYRSIILYADEAQQQAAKKAIAAAQSKLEDPIVTELVPLQQFWPAEDYHQNYFAKNPEQGYCQYVVRPKVKKVQEALKK